jgi:hypothetical protein
VNQEVAELDCLGDLFPCGGPEGDERRRVECRTDVLANQLNDAPFAMIVVCFAEWSTSLNECANGNCTRESFKGRYGIHEKAGPEFRMVNTLARHAIALSQRASHIEPAELRSTWISPGHRTCSVPHNVLGFCSGRLLRWLQRMSTTLARNPPGE